MNDSSTEPPLAGRIALVAGATRGAGRAIAIELGAAGATVYATGRSTRGNPSPMARPETIEETAELIDAAGGHGIAVRVDHSQSDEVAALVARIDEEHGRLDILVNDIWGGDPLTEWRPFWEHDLANGLAIQQTGVHTHLVTSWHAVPLMIKSASGLVVEITDGVDERYRGSLYYDLAKSAVIRLARAQAEELRSHGIAAVAISPGFLRSEAMLDHFGVTEATWRDAIAQDRHFAASETPHFVARGIAALAADPSVMRRTGQALGSWHLGRDYDVRDLDGSRPDWGEHFEREVLPELEG
jgi:NAD(P)-dependent dehydrogenase (short-subunit alcohol dehydrogenase family)